MRLKTKSVLGSAKTGRMATMILPWTSCCCPAAWNERLPSSRLAEIARPAAVYLELKSEAPGQPYWSSTSFADFASSVFTFHLGFGNDFVDGKIGENRFVWPVRGGQ